MSRIFEFFCSFVFLVHCASALIPPDEIPTTTTSTVSTVADAQHYVHYTGAVYCDVGLDDWSCFECAATGSGVTLKRRIDNAGSQTRAIVNVNTVRGEIVITFRGTLNAANLISNSDTTLYPPYPGTADSAIEVHQGNWVALETLYPDVTAELRVQIAAYPTYPIVITGHSLGGVLSSLMFLKLKHDAEFSSKTYAVYTYGMRRAGNQAFATWFNAQPITVVRTVNRGDIIPQQTLQSQGYLHINTELWITAAGNKFCNRSVYEDNSCSNSLQLYNFIDHLFYWTTDYTKCPIEDYAGIALNSPTVFAQLYNALRDLLINPFSFLG